MARDWNKSRLVKTDDEQSADEAKHSAGGDSAATGGSRGAEFDTVIAPLLLLLNGPVVGERKKERLVESKEEFGGGKIKCHLGYLPLAYGDGGPLVPGTAEEGWMVLLEEVVAMLTRKKTSDLINKAGEAGNAKARERESSKGGKPEVGCYFAGHDPAMKWMAASSFASKSRKAGKLVPSSETRAK